MLWEETINISPLKDKCGFSSNVLCSNNENILPSDQSIVGQMGQARWASMDTIRKSTTLAQHGHDTIVPVPARGTVYIVPGPQVRAAALARARHD